MAFVYDAATFSMERTFSYPGEAWGLTDDGTRLIMSDGSDTLRLLDPATFRERARISVRDGSAVVRNLNELEFVNGEIYANICTPIVSPGSRRTRDASPAGST